MAGTLPVALAIAASPFPLIPAILLLFTARPRPTSLSFLAGWAAGILGAVVVFALLAEFVDAREQTPAWVSWVRLALGVALVALGIQHWLSRDQKSEPPAWMRSLTSSRPATAFRLALALTVLNPKILLLAAAGGLAIGAETSGPGPTAVAVCLFTLVASVSVAVPVLGYAVLGERVLGPLTVVKGWLERNSATLMAVVITVIGLVLVAKAVAAL